MLSKFLEKKIEIIPQEISDNSGNPLELEYYLVECEMGRDECISIEKGYGVEIVKKENGSIKESTIIRGIYYNRESTESLVKKLAVNTVTPVTLTYVLDDMIGI